MAVPSSPTFTAFLAGTVVPLDVVPDPVFAQQIVGGGVAVQPAYDVGPVVATAPVGGTQCGLT